MSHDKIKENQRLSIVTMLSAFALLVAGFFLFELLIGGTMDQTHQMAIGKAQSLAYQIAALDSKKAVEMEKSGRGPASITPEDINGSMGADPWGQPYHYKIRHEGRKKVVDVWSTGEHAIQTQVLIPSDSQ